MAEGGNDGGNAGAVELADLNQVVQGLRNRENFLFRHRRQRRTVSPTPAEALGLAVYEDLDFQDEYRLYGDYMRRAVLGLEQEDTAESQELVPHRFTDTLRRARELEYSDNQLELDMFRVVRDNTHHLQIRMNDPTHVYSSIYRANLVYNTEVLVKECANFSYTRALLDQEVAVTTLFQQVTVPVLSLKLSQSSNIFKLGVRYIKDSLWTLMEDHQPCDTYWNVASELFRVMSYFEKGRYLLRDFRLESFRVEEGETQTRVILFANLLTFHFSPQLKKSCFPTAV